MKRSVPLILSIFTVFMAVLCFNSVFAFEFPKSCKVIHVGGNARQSSPDGCVIIDGTNSKIFWVKITRLAANTEDPELNHFYDSMSNPFDYLSSKSYKEAERDTCVTCGTDFSAMELKVNDVVWDLAIGKNESDFFGIQADTSFFEVTTIPVGLNNDAESGRDSSFIAPVLIAHNTVYKGIGGNYDNDYYTIFLKKYDKIKLTIMFDDGPLNTKLDYDFFETYINDSGKLVLGNRFYCKNNGKSNYVIGNSNKDKVMPLVGQGISCIFSIRKTGTHYLVVRTPGKFIHKGTPPTNYKTKKSDFKISVYSFSIKILKKEASE